MRLPVTAGMKRRFLAALEPIRHGRLHLTTPEGVHQFGQEGPQADMTIRDWAFLPALVARGDVGFGESWIAGHWDSNDLEALLTLALRNLDQLPAYANPGPLARLRFLLFDRVLRANSLRGSSRNIRAHYDVGNEFYQLWLDPGMTYSSALFDGEDSDLERAQRRKNDRILSRLSPGDSVLEIGCGWGGFAERAAEHGRRVTGLTLSPAQKAYADARLDGRADIRLQDYRQVGGRFDNIVSIEMIEAVGERWWPVYFTTLKARLAEGGRAVLQAITVPDAEFSIYRRRSDFIRQHIFPGGMLPCNAVMAREAAEAGLQLRHSFSFGQDYALTCRIWAERMEESRARILRQGYDTAFLRGWTFYLLGCAAAFATARTDVVQAEFVHA
ncbi:SAM-dependent methyltransferase [Pseudodonghicola flavimaris]|uniref:Cyclopropane-fatty-acyl-phospholipid synthase family protein n=1 Tax=Pseudodonghicola flavimaris TaxID=3050036 RepID=A0ABT7F1V5_9RHOB|nr:cyclopropane-fatty-acyl-phospholipid synthase family protein [Pseudodonghicola flavimaris]MDK3018588.1 cyclopropane-fatty-acyl-phospholipid synthase family protein [Pseudodonghicola flavimaris]